MKIFSPIYRFLTVLLSLIATPLLLFISSTNKLYLNNQDEMDNQLEVVFPFVELFFLFLILGLIAYFLSRYRPFKYVVWAYYLLGPFFLLLSFLPSNQTNSTGSFDSPTTFVFLTILLLLISIFMARKFDLSRVVIVFATFSLALAANEIYLFKANFKPYSPPSTLENTITQNPSEEHLPNIYHIVLDEYQTDMFELTLSPKVKADLGGFVYYPDNRTVYGRTRMSLASTFLGKSYDYKQPQIEYLNDSLATKKSFVYLLKKFGYTTRAYYYKGFMYDKKLFDQAIKHEDNADIDVLVDYGSVFNSMWIYNNMPTFVAKKLVPRNDLKQIKSQAFLPDVASVLSYVSLLNIMNNEQYLPNYNRYTFVHVLVPHFPNVLSSECQYEKNLAATTPLEQSNCATKMIIDFVHSLSKLDRFDDSLIIIHGDHGSGYEVKNKELVGVPQEFYSLPWSTARSRALLLVKPIGNDESEKFVISGAESTPLDIAPTILKSIGRKSEIDFEGVSLVDPVLLTLERERYYHFYDSLAGVAGDEMTDKMTRFKIKDGKLRLDKTIFLKNSKN